MNAELLWKNELRNILFIGDNYFKWSNVFTLQYDRFSDDTSFYQSNAITEIDRENIRNLCCLYKVVDNYATKNYFFGEKTNYGYSYDIKYQDSFYQVSFMQGQGGVFLLDKKNESDNYIDYDALKELSSVVQKDQIEKVINKKLSKRKRTNL